MKNARLRQTRQSDSRERSSFHHDLAGDADALVVSRSQSRTQHERWQSHHSSPDVAQTGIGGGDERIRDRPQTSYALTAKGRSAFQEYLRVLEQIVKAGRK